MDFHRQVTFNLPSFLIHKKDVFHIVRRTITIDENLDYHNHDYAEVFWIKEGSGIHLINGEKHLVSKGIMYLIRPTDTHTFVATGQDSGLVVTNMAFYLEDLELFRNRYFPNSQKLFWTTDKQPFSAQLNSDQLNDISSLTDFIMTKPRDYIYLDIMMLNIFKLLKESENRSADDMPHWLSLAIDQYNSPKLFQKGTQGFVELTKRSTDHVNKTLKKYLNQTLTETITKIKINYAAQRLTMTNVPIKTICYDSGFLAISNFYKVFQEINGMSPGKFRKLNHKVF